MGIYIYMWSLPLQDLDFQLSTGFYSIKCLFFASNIFIKFKVLDQSGWPCTCLLLIFNIICLALKDTQYIIKNIWNLCLWYLWRWSTEWTLHCSSFLVVEWWSRKHWMCCVCFGASKPRQKHICFSQITMQATCYLLILPVHATVLQSMLSNSLLKALKH